MLNKREKGKEGENIALQRYLDHGWSFVDANYTIRGGEIDLIVENDTKMIFIEVKILDWIDDLHDYITKQKLQYLKRAIKSYLVTRPTQKEIQLDVVFVQQGKVLEVFENVTMQ